MCTYSSAFLRAHTSQYGKENEKMYNFLYTIAIVG
jgi:hypothetical protein